MAGKFVLFTSNCYGEDKSAALIAVELKKILQRRKIRNMGVAGASLISEGGDYTGQGIDLVSSSFVPPSGGFPTKSTGGFLKDLFSGSFKAMGHFVRNIRGLRDRIPLAVVVGDVFLLRQTRKALGKKARIAFLSLPKSDYIEPHYSIEEWYIKKAADLFLVRDAYTAGNLNGKGVPALYLGNPIMDGLEPGKKEALELRRGTPLVGILPGSREEAYANLLRILVVVELVSKKMKCSYAAALPGTLSDEGIRRAVSGSGWHWLEDKPFHYLTKSGIKVVLARGAFPEIIRRSAVIIGLAGTANEQAAGAGTPVVTFAGAGPQTSRARMSDQQKLLGESVKFVRDYPYGAANEVLALLSDPKEMRRRGGIGKKRMGGPGAAKKIAEEVYQLLKS